MTQSFDIFQQESIFLAKMTNLNIIIQIDTRLHVKSKCCNFW